MSLGGTPSLAFLTPGAALLNHWCIQTSPLLFVSLQTFQLSCIPLTTPQTTLTPVSSLGPPKTAPRHLLYPLPPLDTI